MSPRSARPETGRLGSRGGVSLSPDLLLPLPRHAQRHPRAHQEKRPRQPLECPTGEGKCERCPSQGRLSVRRPPLRAATVPPGPSEGLRPLPASLTPAITPRFPASNWGGPRARGWGRGGERGSRLRSSPRPAGAEEIKAVPRRWPSAGGTSPGCPTPPGENKRRDLERDPAASNRSRMSWTQPPRLEGRRSWAGLPRPGHWEEGRMAERARRTWRQVHRRLRAPAASWHCNPASHLRSKLPLDVELPLEGRGGGGGLRGASEPTGAFESR